MTPTRFATAGLVSALCASLLGGAAAAEDGEEERGADAASEVRAQAEKVLRLMRENEAALLEASRAGGEAPKAVKVEPPAPEPEPKRDATPPAGSGGDDDAKRRARLDELVRESVERGRSIPKELEELVRMIPT